MDHSSITERAKSKSLLFFSILEISIIEVSWR